MHVNARSVAFWVLAAAPTATAGTLNLQDVSATRVVQTVAELASNEKAMDVGDFDADGDLDVVIANAFSDFGNRRNKLYRNDGGVLQEVSGAPVIPGFSVGDVSRGAFLRDFDGDGWLDIVVINDSNGGQSNKLYFNVQVDGAFDHFEETSLGVGGAAGGAVSVDVDLDDDFDLFIAAAPNTSQNVLLLNDGSGAFVDVTPTYVPRDSDFSVDTAASDLNGDGKLDLLISNDGNLNNTNKIYYNDLPGTDSTGPGDFQYVPSGVQLIPNPSADENAMEPGDFNGDGLVDVYWSQAVMVNGDRILQNAGIGADGKAQFDMLPDGTLPPSVTAVISRKATVADLNDDGRLDVVVMKQDFTNSRPTILRNVSVGGDTAFVDWTPASAFPDGQVHRGWHAAVFDSNGDGDLDVLVGGGRTNTSSKTCHRSRSTRVTSWVGCFPRFSISTRSR